MPKKTTVALEDLLRVKRAERPPVEFWSEFERELRAKQLAAIVEPRPWWSPFIRFGSRVSRYQLPVGAAAILALSFVSIREYQTDRYETVLPAPALTGPVATVSPIEAPEIVSQPTLAPAERPAPAAVAPSEVAVTGRSSHTIALPTMNVPVSEPTPSAMTIAANLAAVQADNPNLINEAFGRMVRSVEVREPVRDPLAQIGSPRETRRSRLLSSALPVSATTSDFSMPSVDRVAHRLTEDRLYDTISRVGVQGDRVAIHF